MSAEASPRTYLMNSYKWPATDTDLRDLYGTAGQKDGSGQYNGHSAKVFE